MVHCHDGADLSCFIFYPYWVIFLLDDQEVKMGNCFFHDTFIRLETSIRNDGFSCTRKL